MVSCGRVALGLVGICIVVGRPSAARPQVANLPHKSCSISNVRQSKRQERDTSAVTARFGASAKPLADAHGSDRSHDGEGVAAELSKRLFDINVFA